MNINEYLVDVLEKIGVDHVFGGSGQVNASFIIALNRSKKIKTLITKNEQAAAFAACGYAMFSKDKLGVCFATGGPGAFNVMSGLGVALSDSLPVLAITGYEAKDLLGKGALAETSGLNRTPDSQAMFAATTKKTYIITDPARTCDIVEDAINTAFEGRPGPVHIHIPIDLTMAEVPNPREAKIVIKPVVPDPWQIDGAAAALAEAISGGKRVMALLGYGAVRAEAEREILKLVETYQVPFATTMDGKGLLSEAHPLSLGTFGTAGDQGARKYFDGAGLVLAIGNSFAQNATFRFDETLFKGKKLVHVNIDQRELGKVYKPDYPVLGDAALAAAELNKELARLLPERPAPAAPVKEKWYDRPVEYAGDKVHPAEMVKLLSKNLPPDSIILGDAGGHMLWLNCYLNLAGNQRYQNPGTFGPMASGVNGAIGVKCAHPGKTVVSACGDGGYLMGGFELLTAVQYGIPVIWIIFNNGEFNIIKNFLMQLYRQAPMMRFNNPDYAAYARACGAEGFRVEKTADFEAVFKKALALNKPVLIDVAVEENVYPPFSLKGI